MGTGLYLPDAWLWPITLTADNNTIQLDENSGGFVSTQQLEAGEWYLHDDESLHAAGYKGLFYAIRYLTTQSTGSYSTFGTVANIGTKVNSYSFSVSDPTSSTSVTNAGLTMSGSGGAPSTVSWILDVSDSTIDFRHLGFLTATPSDPTSAASGSTRSWESPACMLGRWLPYNHAGAPAAASRKRPRPFKILDYPSARPADGEPNEWYSTTLRDIEYRFQMPGHIHQSRADETGYASQSGLAAGDKNNAFYHVWDKLTAGKKLIIVHNSTSDLQVDANDYEIVKLHQDTPWDAMVQATSDAADLYRITATVDVLSGNYAH